MGFRGFFFFKGFRGLGLRFRVLGLQGLCFGSF